MTTSKESVFYYQPEKDRQGGNFSKSAMMKAVLVRLGIRIRNVAEDQTGQTVGYLAGCDGFEETQAPEGAGNPIPEQEMLVMKNFTSRRIDEMLAAFKKAGIPRIELKAVITDTNVDWTFYQLYEELKKEHEIMSKKDQT